MSQNENVEESELWYLQRRVRELERENIKLELRLKELEKKYWAVRSEISDMLGEDQYYI